MAYNIYSKAGTDEAISSALADSLPDLTDYVQTTDDRLTDARTPTTHGHSIANVTGLQGALDGKQPAGSYAASAHTHAPADITGTAVITTDPRLSDARTPTAHTHPASAISDSTATGRSVLTAADAAAARTAIGAGTSSLAIGTTGTTAAAGNRQATETSIGMVELATTAEATTGTDTTRAVTPAGLKAVADTKAASTHTHDDRYYTETEADARYLQTATAQPINPQTGTTYTLVASDAGKLVTLTNSAAITLTVPGNVFTAGQRVDCLVADAGMVTAVGSSCTVTGTPSLVSRAQWSAFTVLFTSATTAVMIGDLA